MPCDRIARWHGSQSGKRRAPCGRSAPRIRVPPTAIVPAPPLPPVPPAPPLPLAPATPLWLNNWPHPRRRSLRGRRAGTAGPAVAAGAAGTTFAASTGHAAMAQQLAAPPAPNRAPRLRRAPTAWPGRRQLGGASPQTAQTLVGLHRPTAAAAPESRTSAKARSHRVARPPPAGRRLASDCANARRTVWRSVA